MEYRVSPEELIDITMPLSDDTPAWPGDIRFRKETTVVHGFRTSKLTMLMRQRECLLFLRMDQIYPSPSRLSSIPSLNTPGGFATGGVAQYVSIFLSRTVSRGSS